MAQASSLSGLMPSASGLDEPSLLSKVAHADIVHQPFPHLVVRNALDAELADRLLEEMPPIPRCAPGQVRGNARVNYPARVWRDDPAVSPTWKRFLNEHVNQTFLDKVMGLFGSDLKRLHPGFEERCAPLDRLRAGLLYLNELDCDVMLDAQLCANTPVLDRWSAARGARIYSPNKIFVGQYYLRNPADTSTGGDLELYRRRPSSTLRRLGRVVSPEDSDLCRTVGYEHNVLVLFLNSIHAVHQVTSRSPSHYPRVVVSLSGEVRDPLWRFQKSPYSQTQQRLLWYARTRERARTAARVMPRAVEDSRSSA